MFRLEPREIFDKAILRADDDMVIYSYELLIAVLIEVYMSGDEELHRDEAYIIASDDVNFNIISLICNRDDVFVEYSSD